MQQQLATDVLGALKQKTPYPRFIDRLKTTN